MSLSIGIVGLPNVGKSTLFNAFLKRQQALSANYPFATIEPNIGVVDVPDIRVDRLSELSHSKKRVYANITFVDIAGIVEGAHKGEGLGNRFLANIREVDLVLILLRDFLDESVVKEGSKDPENDYAVIMTELILKDIETIQKQEKRLKGLGSGENDLRFKSAVEKVLMTLEKGRGADEAGLSDNEIEQILPLHLLTLKPRIKLLNVDEEAVGEKIKEYESSGPGTLIVSAKIESELSSLSEEDQKAYLNDLNLESSLLSGVIKVCYETLGLQTFLTTGPLESRAWKFKGGMSAKECAGIIHTDFSKKFIKAEVIKYEDFVSLGGKQQAKDAGKLRFEGKGYLMQDGDVVEFKVGA